MSVIVSQDADAPSFMNFMVRLKMKERQKNIYSLKNLNSKPKPMYDQAGSEMKKLP